MSNMNGLISKLQLALKQKGKVYCVSRNQHYSPTYKCFCTKYTVYTTYIDENGDKQKSNYYFDKQLEVVQFLVSLLKDDST